MFLSVCAIEMRISKADLILISGIHREKHWGAIRICKFFVNKHWSVASVNRVLTRIRRTGSEQRRPGSGRRPSVNIEVNRNAVRRLVSGGSNGGGIGGICPPVEKLKNFGA